MLDWLTKILAFDLGIALGDAASTSMGTSIALDYCPRGAVAQSPSDLIGAADRVAWWRGDQGITLNATRVANWEDAWNGEDLVQGTAGSQPLFESTGFLGQPCSFNDDGARKLLCTLATPIPTSTRVYMVVFLQVTLNAGLYMFTVSDAGAANNLLSINNGAVNWQSWRQETAAIAENIIAVAYDTNRHRYELGYTVGGTAARVIDSTPTNTAISGTNTTATMTLVRAHCRYDAVNGLRSRIPEIILFKNPTAGILSGLRTYGAARYVGLP